MNMIKDLLHATRVAYNFDQFNGPCECEEPVKKPVAATAKNTQTSDLSNAVQQFITTPCLSCANLRGAF